MDERINSSSEASAGYGWYDFTVGAACRGGLVESLLVLATIATVVLIAQFWQFAFELLNPFSAVVGTQSATTGRRLHSLQLLLELLNKCFEFFLSLAGRIASLDPSTWAWRLLWKILTSRAISSRRLSSCRISPLVFFGWIRHYITSTKTSLNTSIRFFCLVFCGRRITSLLRLFGLLLLASFLLAWIWLFDVANQFI